MEYNFDLQQLLNIQSEVFYTNGLLSLPKFTFTIGHRGSPVSSQWFRVEPE